MSDRPKGLFKRGDVVYWALYDDADVHVDVWRGEVAEGGARYVKLTCRSPFGAAGARIPADIMSLTKSGAVAICLEKQRQALERIDDMRSLQLERVRVTESFLGELVRAEAVGS